MYVSCSLAVAATVYKVFRYVVCSLDFTVYPAAATYVRKAFECLANVAAMSSSHIGFIFMPVHQKQTTEPAVLKHRRQIEENLMKSKMSLANEVCILFAKPEARVTDGRAMTQISLLSLHQNYTSNSDWNSSSAVTTARIGPAPLIRISDMLGFDEVSKPSASARVEQILDLSRPVFQLFAILAPSIFLACLFLLAAAQEGSGLLQINSGRFDEGDGD